MSSLFRRKLDELESMFITSQDDLMARFSSTYEENKSLKAEVERLTETGRWKPITTAPRDGTHILVSVHEGSVWQMFWGVPVSLQLGGNVSEADKRWVTSVGCFPINGITTHWMPIPQPPSMEDER